jgi:GWxTD domain-containing protein
MFYFEVYNLKKQDEPDRMPYFVHYKILDSYKKLVREFPGRKKIKPGNSVVEVGGINIITLISGTYFLQVEINDSTNNRTAAKTEKFFVYRSGDYENQQSDSLRKIQETQQIARMIKNVYSSMSEEEIDEEFGAASYIASSNEKSIYKKLDIDGKREFMVEFWAKRDEKPETPQNEFRNDYLSRVNIAIKQFPGFKKGWKSDEGRVLLVYGAPDEVERFPSSTDNRAYRIWHYYSLQGGVEFIFVDRRGWGEYELVHSSARGEIFDYDWQRWINPAK